MPSAPKWYAIINPTSGNGKAERKWLSIEKKLKAANIHFEVGFTQHQGHAIELSKQAILNGYRHLIAVGGDGTNNEVMNGILMQNEVPTTAITQALIPIGTGNDWIKTHNIPNDIDKAIQSIKNGKTTLQDIGLATFYVDGKQQQRYFLNVAGLAYDAFLCKKSNEERSLSGSKFLYFYLIFRCLFEYTPQKAKVSFKADDSTVGVIEDKFYGINVGICKYSGGGMQLVPQSVPDDGLFALTTVSSLSIPKVIISTPYLYGGRVKNFSKATLHQAKTVKIEAQENVPVMLEVDGEYVGVTPVEFTMKEKAFRFVIP